MFIGLFFLFKTYAEKEKKKLKYDNQTSYFISKYNLFTSRCCILNTIFYIVYDNMYDNLES